MDLRIDNPLFLLLFIPAIVYFVYVWRKQQSEWKRRQWAVFTLRILSVLTLIVALTNPYFLLPIEKEQVVFLIDRSASIESEMTKVNEFMEQALPSKKENQAVGIYSFANSMQTEALLANTVNQLPTLSEIEDIGHTNIEEALKLTESIVDSKLPTRIVLLSDGLETKGNSSLQANQFVNSMVSIDVVPLEKTTKSDVILERFDTPQVAFNGEEQQFAVSIFSDATKEAEITIFENNTEIVTQNIQLQEGSNKFVFKHMTKATGLVKYEAMVNVDQDAFLQNNRLASVTNIQAAPQLLIVQTEEQPSRIPQIIGNETIATTIINSADLPANLSSYLPYQAIIFDNVPAHQVGEAKMTVIEQAVKTFGVGFMMVGGDQSYGLGGYYQTPVEALLPVSMDVTGEKEMPSLGLVLVIDRSGSMMGSKMLLAKEAAARSIELLRDDDTLGVIAFDDRPWTVVETSKLEDKEAVKEDVLSIPAGGGTEIYTPLSEAYDSLADLKLQRKHIILLTDGYGASNPDYEDLVQAGLEKGITLSTVAIGRDSDRALLEDLSISGQGRFYDVVDETTIPAILSRETSMMTRTYIVDEPFVPTIYNAEKWVSLFTAGVPKMNAYIATTPKPLASVIAESEKEDPILTTWQYGLGTTIAFTSDSSGAWAGDWATWSNWRQFWQNAITQLLPEYHEVAYSLQSQGNGRYTITDVSKEATFLQINAVNEKGESLPVSTDIHSASQVEVQVEGDPGLVFLSLTNKDGEMQKIGVQLPYSDEFKLTNTNEVLLEELASITGGQVITNPSEVFRHFTKQGFESREIAKYLVFVALLLFFLDITLRRFTFARKRKGKAEDLAAPNEKTAVDDLVEQLKRSRTTQK